MAQLARRLEVSEISDADPENLQWTTVGGLSFIVSLSMAEIAAALPTAGGIYYWAYRLGGPEWGYDLFLEKIYA